jgi:hypothetical protein
MNAITHLPELALKLLDWLDWVDWFDSRTHPDESRSLADAPEEFRKIDAAITLIGWDFAIALIGERERGSDDPDLYHELLRIERSRKLERVRLRITGKGRAIMAAKRLDLRRDRSLESRDSRFLIAAFRLNAIATNPNPPKSKDIVAEAQKLIGEGSSTFTKDDWSDVMKNLREGHRIRGRGKGRGATQVLTSNGLEEAQRLSKRWDEEHRGTPRS